MKNTTYLVIFLLCNLVQIGYFINYDSSDRQIKGESTVSVYIGQLPTPMFTTTPTNTPAATNTPTSGPSSTPTPTVRTTVTPIVRITTPTSIVYRIPTSFPTPTYNPDISPTPTPATPISNYKATIFGLTSPNSVVQLSNPSIFIETNSDEKGNFSFTDQYFPTNSPEVCLETKDDFGRSSSPICLPPIPTDYQANIGPVIIPPTLSSDKSIIYAGDAIEISGKSIPDSQVEISTYTDEVTDKLALFPKAYAKANPRTTTNTDSKGNFSIKIPTLDKMKLKTFARVYYEKKPSDKSPILNVAVYINWMYVFIYIQKLIDLLRTNLLALTFMIEVIIALVFITRYLFHPDRIKKVKYMASKQL